VPPSSDLNKVDAEVSASEAKITRNVFHVLSLKSAIYVSELIFIVTVGYVSRYVQGFEMYAGEGWRRTVGPIV
jgi:hypothetical protein